MTILLDTILPHVAVEAVVFGLMTLAASWGLAYAWWRRRVELGKDTLPFWRRTVASIGLLSVTAQALLFILSWTRIGRDYALFGQWARWILPTFLVAAPCVLAGKGPSRWWLLASSVLLFIICFFITLSA
jgi:hypothetical protein